jgi:hypothetical protein
MGMKHCTWSNVMKPFVSVIYFFTIQATLMRRSTVQSLPIQLVFPGSIAQPQIRQS